jgi:predicted chitinase
MVSCSFLGSRSLVVWAGAALALLGACGVDGSVNDGPSGSAGAGANVGVGSGPGAAGATSFAGSNLGSAGSAPSAGAGPIGGGGAPSSSAGASSAGGASNNGGATGATCSGITAWTSGTSASVVSHNGKKYSCKVAGWCVSTALAYEPGVGFAWQDAWEDDGNCGNGNGGGFGGAPASGGAPGAAGGGNGSAGAPSSGCALDAVLGENNFQAWFPNRNGFYTYANMCKAIGKYPPFATSGDTTAKKREVAAFLANVARETGMLKYIDQINKDPANGNYWGRGPLQITWDYNYKACGNAIGENLLGQPTLVSTDGAITWETALWFWMTNDGGTGKTPHTAIVGGSFGGTIDAINGGLECNGPNEGANERIAHYQAFTQALGVDPGGNLTCW